MNSPRNKVWWGLAILSAFFAAGFAFQVFRDGRLSSDAILLGAVAIGMALNAFGYWSGRLPLRWRRRPAK